MGRKDRAPYGYVVRTRLAGGLLVAALATAACGVPVQTRPVALTNGQLPAGLTHASTTTTLPGSAVPVSLVQVYFVAGDRLVVRSRLVPSPGSLPETLADLLAGPTPAESIAGIRTSIDPGTELLSERVTKDKVVLDLSSAFTNTGGPDQILSIAQLVYTATAVAGINSVSFELQGSPVAVPLADGTLATDPVTRDAYAALVEPPPATGPSKPS
jgi:spore germination protein GerM